MIRRARGVTFRRFCPGGGAAVSGFGGAAGECCGSPCQPASPLPSERENDRPSRRTKHSLTCPDAHGPAAATAGENRLAPGPRLPGRARRLPAYDGLTQSLGLSGA